jgi:hypothetical protein
MCSTSGSFDCLKNVETVEDCFQLILELYEIEEVFFLPRTHSFSLDERKFESVY